MTQTTVCCLLVVRMATATSVMLTMCVYLETVLQPLIQGPSVIVFDNLDCHMSESSKNTIYSWGCIPCALPKYSTSACQLLSVGVMGPFKKFLQLESIKNGLVKGTTTEKRAQMVEQIIKCYNKCDANIITRSFDKALYSAVDLFKPT